MSVARLLSSMGHILESFQYGGSAYFTKVTPWQPEMQQRLDLADSVPFCGIEHVRDEHVANCPGYSQRNHRLALHVIMAMPAAPTPTPTEPDHSIKDAIIRKAEVRDALIEFLLTTVANHLPLSIEGLEVTSVDFAGEDLIFTGQWEKMGGEYMASLYTVLIKNLKENLT